MSVPRVVAVAPGSPAARAGLAEGDQIVTVNGEVPRDLIEWRVLIDEAHVALEVNRGGLETLVDVNKRAGEPLGVEVHSALFDRVRTCDNHCEFCFIYQLPPGLRRSLYLKDDDYRLSFLYGNFTTLTRFTEADLERVVTEGLSPLYVSIHATDPEVRAEMLRNRRGATSLRWLRALLDHGVEVHGQVVVCPGVNDGSVLDETLAGVLDRYPELATLSLVPLGVSRYNTEARMRPHTGDEAAAVLDAVHDWQDVFRTALGRRLVFAADEYYLLANQPFPLAEAYEGFPMYEDGVGMARALEAEVFDQPGVGDAAPERGGFFHWADGDLSASTDTDYEPYRSRSCQPAPEARSGVRSSGAGSSGGQRLHVAPSRRAPVAVLTAPYGARVLRPLLDRLGRPDVRVVPVENCYFGGNIAVSGLMVGDDLARTLADEPPGQRYLLPDVCLSQGRFLDGTEPADLPRPVEIVPADGTGLRAALGVSPKLVPKVPESGRSGASFGLCSGPVS
jgi:putative radical SAM enzyme (TIGR03279 family)